MLKLLLNITFLAVCGIPWLILLFIKGIFQGFMTGGSRLRPR